MKRKLIYNKTKLNFVMDALLFLDFSAMIGIGLMIKYVLLTGEQKKEIFGVNFEQTFLGLNRHGWGNIHLYLGFIFLGLILLHIIIHWSLIVAMFKKFFERFRMKKSIAFLFTSVCFLLIVVPLFILPVNGKMGNEQSDIEHENQLPSENFHKKNTKDKISQNEFNTEAREETKLTIRGYMSIADVCTNFNIPSEYLKEKIGVSSVISNNTALSTLRKQYGIKMREIKNIIIKYTNQHKYK